MASEGDKKPKRPAPTAEYIRHLRAESELDSLDDMDEWAKVARVRAGTEPVNIPPPWNKIARPIHTKATADTIRRVVASLTLTMPTVAVPAAGLNYKYQENATLREKWSTAMLAEMDAAFLPDRPFRQGMDHAAAFGTGIWKLVYTPNSWFDYPEAQSMFGKDIAALTRAQERKLKSTREMYKQGRIPFAWRAIDPRTFWSWESEGRMVRCMEVTERPIADILGHFPDADLSNLEPEDVGRAQVKNKTPTKRNIRKFYEYWDDTWVTYMVDNIMLDQWEHGYGEVPYFRFYGLSDASKPAGHQGESVVAHIIDKEIAVDDMMAMKYVWAFLTAFPMGTIEGPEGGQTLAGQPVGPEGEGEQQLGPDIEFKSGVFKAIPPGWKAGWMEAPHSGKDLNDAIKDIKEDLDEIIPSVLKGVSVGGRTAGYAINQLITTARLVFDPISDNAAVALGKMVQFMWRLIEKKIKEKVYVLGEDPNSTEATDKGKKWLGLGPDDIFNYYACTVNIAPLVPENRIAEGQFGLQAWQAKAIPWRMYLEEFLKVPNPDEIMMERLVEDEVYMGQGSLHQWAVQQAMKLAEMDQILKEQQQAAMLSGVQLPPGIEERMAGGMAAGPGLPTPGGLAPSPGSPGGQMPLAPGAEMVPGVPGGPPSGPGMPNTMPLPGGPPNPGLVPPPALGGRAAGVGIQPNTQGLPGGVPGAAGGAQLI